MDEVVSRWNPSSTDCVGATSGRPNLEDSSRGLRMTGDGRYKAKPWWYAMRCMDDIQCYALMIYRPMDGWYTRLWRDGSGFVRHRRCHPEQSEGSGRRKCKMQSAKCKIDFQLSIFNFFSGLKMTNSPSVAYGATFLPEEGFLDSSPRLRMTILERITGY